MTHYFYILYSKTINRFYIGESNNPDTRLDLHNQHHFKKGFTKAASDWELKLKFKCTNKEDAIYLEKFTKRMKSSKFIKRIISDQNIIIDILSKKN